MPDFLKLDFLLIECCLSTNEIQLKLSEIKAALKEDIKHYMKLGVRTKNNIQLNLTIAKINSFGEKNCK